MYTLYYSPGACSLSVHVLLEELGIEYKLNEANIARGDLKNKSFLNLNPRARVPVLEWNGEILTEAVSILQFLADRHPEKKLIPAPGELLRARCQEWLSYLTSTFHPLYWGIWRPRRISSNPEHDKTIYDTTHDELKRRYIEVSDFLDTRKYLLGDDLSVADFYLFVYMRWARRIELSLASLPGLRRLNDTLLERTAVRRALHQEGLEA